MSHLMPTCTTLRSQSYNSNVTDQLTLTAVSTKTAQNEMS